MMTKPKQPMLFASEDTHFGPTPTPGLPSRQRQALCGTIFALAGSDPIVTALGSSDLKFVTCVVCLDIAEARKKIGEAGE